MSGSDSRVGRRHDSPLQIGSGWRIYFGAEKRREEHYCEVNKFETNLYAQAHVEREYVDYAKDLHTAWSLSDDGNNEN